MAAHHPDKSDPTSELVEPCPHCGSGAILFGAEAMRCGFCYAAGPKKPTRPERLAAWNYRPSADTISRLQREAEAMAEALSALAVAESTYRYCHDILGAGDRKTGRAWDLMKRAGDRARQALALYRKGQPNAE